MPDSAATWGFVVLSFVISTRHMLDPVSEPEIYDPLALTVAPSGRQAPGLCSLPARPLGSASGSAGLDAGGSQGPRVCSPLDARPQGGAASGVQSFILFASEWDSGLPGEKGQGKRNANKVADGLVGTGHSGRTLSQDSGTWNRTGTHVGGPSRAVLAAFLPWFLSFHTMPPVTARSWHPRCPSFPHCQSDSAL